MKSLLISLLLVALAHAQSGVQLSGPATLSGQTQASVGAPPAPPLFQITTAGLPSVNQNAAYPATTIQTRNGIAPVTCANPAGMPTGVSIASNCAISGTATGAPGNYPITVVATDSTPVTPKVASAALSISVTCPPLAILSPSTLPQATQGTAYGGFLMQSSGGVAPLTWSNPTGAFPTGMSINGAGSITGTPSVAGTFTPTVKVVDSCPAPQSASQQETLVVVANSGPLTLTNTTPLPSCNVNQTCTIPLGATGGTPPYVFTAPGGWLPAGLSIVGAAITGTTSVVGAVTGTLTVTDNVLATNSGASPYSLTVNPQASGGVNPVCAPNETWSGPAIDQTAAAPVNCVRTALSDMVSPGSTVTVVANSFSDLQTKVTAASCGQTISVPPGTYTGQLVLPGLACTNGHWVTVVTSQVAALPIEGSRISPAWVGSSTLIGRPPFAQPAVAGNYLPKIINSTLNQPSLACTAGLSHWHLRGLQITSTAGVNVQNALANCATADHLVINQDVLNGGNSSIGQDRDLISQGVNFGACTYCAVQFSYIYDIHCLTNTCADSYPVFLGGSAATNNGPIKIFGNYLEAAGESCGLSGGGGQGAGHTTGVLVDVEHQFNDCFKPDFWFGQSPNYFGTSFELKNAFEMKNVNRLYINGDIFDGAYAQGDQFATLVLLGAKNQSSPYSGTADSNGAGQLTWKSGQQFRSTVVSPLCAKANQCLVKYAGTAYHATSFTSATLITVTPIPPAATAQSFTAFDPGLNPTAVVKNVTLKNSILRHASRGVAIFAIASDGGDPGLGDQNISIHDITLDGIDGSYYATTGGCCNWGSAFQLQNSNGSPTFLDSISIFHVTVLPKNSTGAPFGTASMGFGFQTNPTGAIGHLVFRDNLGPAGFYTGQAGVCTVTSSAQALFNCWSPQKCVDHNWFTTQTTGSFNGTRNNPPYPAPADNNICGFTATGNTVITGDYTSFHFVNLNGASGGDYHLTDLFRNAASDGTDPGANISAIQSATAGVQ